MSLHRKPKSQQAFLLEAMQRMEMDADQFARRLGASPQRLGNWLKNPGELGYAELDPVIWTFVRELVQRAEEREARESVAASLGGPEVPLKPASFGMSGRWLA